MQKLLTSVIKEVINDYGLPSFKCVGFGSDGASVMVGRENGVAALMKQENLYLISIHCAAHRLAQASSQAAEGIAVMLLLDTRKPCLLSSHFSCSSIHAEQLLVVQQVLQEPEIKLFEVR